MHKFRKQKTHNLYLSSERAHKPHKYERVYKKKNLNKTGRRSEKTKINCQSGLTQKRLGFKYFPLKLDKVDVWGLDNKA